MAGNQGNNRIVWSAEMEQFLKDNFHKMTNQQLADSLGLKLTIVRTRCYSLGLKRQEKHRWTKQQKEFLKANYRTMGNIDLIENLKKLDRRQKNWSASKITSQMSRMGLARTEEENKVIWQKHKENKRYGLNSVYLDDKYVVGLLSRGQNLLAKSEYLNHPELIELKRSQLLLNRALKEVKK